MKTKNKHSVVYSSLLNSKVYKYYKVYLNYKITQHTTLALDSSHRGCISFITSGLKKPL